MDIKYFLDTDTAHMEFARKPVFETREINKDIYIDLDKDGNLVNITVEHAREKTMLPELHYQELKGKVA
jgi:uncharacterized protein YuzE